VPSGLVSAQLCCAVVWCAYGDTATRTHFRSCSGSGRSALCAGAVSVRWPYQAAEMHVCTFADLFSYEGVCCTRLLCLALPLYNVSRLFVLHPAQCLQCCLRRVWSRVLFAGSGSCLLREVSIQKEPLHNLHKTFNPLPPCIHLLRESAMHAVCISCFAACMAVGSSHVML
jgi:hypothetical protein